MTAPVLVKRGDRETPWVKKEIQKNMKQRGSLRGSGKRQAEDQEKVPPWALRRPGPVHRMQGRTPTLSCLPYVRTARL